MRKLWRWLVGEPNALRLTPERAWIFLQPDLRREDWWRD